MSYQTHFKHADDVIAHLNSLMPSITDPLLKIKYVGFTTVVAITVYEMAIKEILIQFAVKKHKVLGNFTANYFERINGRIKTQVIRDDYLSKFGVKYVKQFDKKLKSISEAYFNLHRREIKNSYANLILWRNDFAHEGKLSTSATYAEVVQAYEDGKEIIRCLNEAMVR